MKSKPQDLLTPSILIVDDEQQIHSALKLRLGSAYKVFSAFNPKEALPHIAHQNLDLCIVDVHMPGMDGFTFIEEARKIDPSLGCVVFSGFDSPENLRRAIPLNVFEFVPKPLPDRHGFEELIPEWIDRTRARRREAALAQESQIIFNDLEVARIERDVELTASASARESLLQSAGALTTAHALLLNASQTLEPMSKTDPRLVAALKLVQEARRQVEVASTAAEGYFGSAYADRESSPALVDSCISHAIAIALRLSRAEEQRKAVDYGPIGRELALTGISGIDFLLLVIPVVVQALLVATPGTTVRIQGESVARLDEVYRHPRSSSFAWINRRNMLSSSPGILLAIRSSGPAFEEKEAAAWLHGRTNGQLHTPSREILQIIQKAKGVIGIATKPKGERLEIVLALPV